MKISERRRKFQSGQAILIVVLAMSIFLLGAVGFAIDGSHLYAQRQMAQAAADAAAQAAILSIFDGTSTAGTNGFSTAAGFTCNATNDARTPCYYAETMNGFNGANDVVTVDYPTAAQVGVGSGILASGYPANILRVVVKRPVQTTLMSLITPTAATCSTAGTWNCVGATGVAAILSIVSPVPIVITHPTNPGTFAFGGNVTIQICGGPQRSIQVNSNNAIDTQSINGNSNIVDLSKGGPLDIVGNCTGSGTDFGNWGAPSTPDFNLLYGANTHYLPQASPIPDPLANIPVPPKPTTSWAGPTHVAAGGSTTVSATYVTSGTVTCPTGASPGGCDFFLPGDYPNGIKATGSNNYIAYFFPGIYYMDSNGFGDGSNGNMLMYPGANSDTSTGGTGAGMLVYNTGSGVFTVGSNGAASLQGSDTSSVYKGILLFEDRNAPANTQKNKAHIVGGGGTLSLIGTIYINNATVATSTQSLVVTPTHYQLLQLQGGGGSGTLIQGEIITNQLLLGGSGTIRMNLNAAAINPVNQVALIN